MVKHYLITGESLSESVRDFQTIKKVIDASRVFEELTYEELTQDSKLKALEHYYDVNVFLDWWQDIYEEFKKCGIKINAFDVERDEIDMFITYDVDTTCGLICEFVQKDSIIEIANNFLKSSSEIIDDEDYDPNYQQLTKNFNNSIKFSILRYLKDAYEYLTSEESVVSSIEANNYTFFPNGKPFLI